MNVSPPLLIARALVSAWRRHPLRALAAIVGVTLGAALTTLVVAIDGSVSQAARAANGTDLVQADLAVKARAGRMGLALGREVRSAASGARSAAVVQVSSRLAEGDVISVLGVDRNAEAFFPRIEGRDVVSGRAEADAPPLVVGASWLEDHGFEVGDVIKLVAPRGVARWTVVGEIPGQLPNGGAIAVGDIESVSFAFDRQGTIDALYLQLPDEATRGETAQRVQAAAGAGVVVGPPEIVSEAGARSFGVVRGMLLIAGMVGLLSALVVVFVCWRLLLEDERASIARFRLTGATPMQLATGSGLVLLAATLVCCAVGIPLGIVAERFLRSVSSQLVEFTGLAVSPSVEDVARPAAAGLVGALVIAASAWAAGLRAFVRITPLEAVRPPDPPPPVQVPLLAVTAGGLLALALGVVVIVLLPIEAAPAAVLLALAGAFLLTIAVPSLLGRGLAPRGGFTTLAAGRHLGADRRRSAAIILMVGLSMTAGLTLGGVAGSYQAAIERTVQSWSHADLFVRLGVPGRTLRDTRFDPDVQRQLAQLPAVRQAGAICFLLIDQGGRNVMLEGYDTRHVSGIADLIVREGPRHAALWRALDDGQAAVSESMARLDDLHVGDSLPVPSTSGERRLRIAAIIDDYVTDGGLVVTSLRTFAEVTGERRIEDIPLRLEAGASRAEVTREIEAALPQYETLTVLDQQEFRAAITGFVTNVVSLFRGLALAAFIIVLLAATLTLAASLAVRRRALAVGQVCGASRGRVTAQLCLEAGAMAIAAWLIAVAVTSILVPGALRSMGVRTGLIPPVQVPVLELVAVLPLGLAVALLAAVFVSRMTLRRDLVEALRFE